MRRSASVEQLEPRQLLSATLQVVGSLGTETIPDGTYGGMAVTGVAVDAAGDVFGVRSFDPSDPGDVYEIPTGSDMATTLASFSSYPVSNLYLDSAGDLFGLWDGANGNTVWELPHGSHTIVNVDPSSPFAAGAPTLAVDAAGDLFCEATTLVSGDAETDLLEYPADGTGRRVVGSVSGGMPFTVDPAGDVFEFDVSNTLYEIPSATVAASTASGPGGSPTQVAPIPQGIGEPTEMITDATGNLFVTTDAGQLVERPAGATAFNAPVKLGGGQTTFQSPPVIDGRGDLFAITYGTTQEYAVTELAAGSDQFIQVAFDSTYLTTAAISPAGDTLYFTTGTGQIGPTPAEVLKLGQLTTGTPVSLSVGTITGTVYSDTVADGTFDSGDTLLPGVTLKLTATNGDAADDQTTVSGASGVGGSYEFIGVPTGTYTLSEVLPSGYTLFQPSGGTYTVTVSGDNTIAREDFGHVPVSVTAPNVRLIGSITGGLPSDLSVDAAGDVYGTIDSGSAAGDTAFRLAAGSGTLTESHPFDPSQTPVGQTVLDANGDLFGVTVGPASPNTLPPNGTLWEWAAGASAIQVLSDFTGSFIAPADLTVDAAGNLYGTATDVATGQTVLWEDHTDGSGPRQLTAPGVAQGPFTVDAAGNLFGVTGTGITGINTDTQPIGGEYTVYEIPAAAVAAATAATPAVPTTLATYAAGDLGTPQGIAVDASDDLYLTATLATFTGTSYNYGVRPPALIYEYAYSAGLLELPAGSGHVRLLASDGFGTARSAPLVDAASDVFAALDSPSVTSGNPDTFAAVELPAGSATVTTVAPVPYNYAGDLTHDADGNLYGTSVSEAAGGDTTHVFEVTGQPFQVGPSPAPTWSRQPEVTPTLTPAPTAGLDPTVARSTVPADAVAGTIVRGAMKVTLTGITADTARSATVIRVYATQSGTIDADSQLVGTLRKRMSVAKGKARMVAVAVRSSTLPVGTYTLLTQVTDGAGDVVTADTGPTLTVAAATVSLSAKITKASTTGATQGKPLSFTLTVTNTGNATSTGAASVAVYLSADGTAHTVAVAKVRGVPKSPKVKAGQSFSYRVTMTVPPGSTGMELYPLALFTQDGQTAKSAAAGKVAIR